jgi:hypothetical protein
MPVVTKENYDRAIKASSAACVVADAIKTDYPDFSNVKVNVAYIRITDKKRGYRYLYLTPPSVAEIILAFDQGWPMETFPRKLRIKQLLKVMPILRSAADVKKHAERRAARLTKLEAKEQSGTPLSDGEQRALGKLRNAKPAPERPTAYGPTKVQDGVIVGRPIGVKNELYDKNLLRERDRHFAAKVAQPSEVFKQAVEEAVKADRAKRRKK